MCGERDGPYALCLRGYTCGLFCWVVFTTTGLYALGHALTRSLSLPTKNGLELRQRKHWPRFIIHVAHQRAIEQDVEHFGTGAARPGSWALVWASAKVGVDAPLPCFKACHHARVRGIIDDEEQLVCPFGGSLIDDGHVANPQHFPNPKNEGLHDNRGHAVGAP